MYCVAICCRLSWQLMQTNDYREYFEVFLALTWQMAKKMYGFMKRTWTTVQLPLFGMLVADTQWKQVTCHKALAELRKDEKVVSPVQKAAHELLGRGLCSVRI